MPTTRLRPDKTIYDQWVARTGGSTTHGVLSDQSDATYVRRDGGLEGDDQLQVGLGTATIAAGERIVSVCPGLRYKLASTTGALVYVGVGQDVPAGTLWLWAVTHGFAKSTSIIDAIKHASAGAWLAPDGADWSQTDVDQAMLSLIDANLGSNTNRAYIYELFADVFTLKPATVALSTPASSVTDTSYPTITAAVSTVVDLWQTNAPGVGNWLTAGSVQVRVFDADTYGAAGFDPATSTPLWQTTLPYNNATYVDGSTPSSVTVSTAPDIAVPNSEDYRVYARASRDVPAGAAFWGEWSYRDFAMNLTLPTAPSVVSATTDAGLGGVGVLFHADATAGRFPLISVQRSADGGDSWTPVRFATALPVTFDVTDGVMDYEAERGEALLYRARIEATISGQQLVSEWSSSAAATAMLPVSGWNFKVPQTPSISVMGVSVLGTPDESRTESVGVFTPRGRTRPVTVAGDLLGYDGSYSVVAAGTSEIDALEALLELQGPLYVETAFGPSKWIRVLSRSRQLRGTLSAPRVYYTIGYVETSRPL